MGEYAEMIINGEMCQYCGELLDDDLGVPSVCESCSEEDGND